MIVRLKGEDSSQLGEWFEADTSSKLSYFVCTTIGHLIYEDENRVVITHTLASNGETHALGYVVIPKRAILSREEVP